MTGQLLATLIVPAVVLKQVSRVGFLSTYAKEGELLQQHTKHDWEDTWRPKRAAERDRMPTDENNDQGNGFRNVAAGLLILATPMMLVWTYVIMSKVIDILRLLEAGVQCK